MCVPALLCGSRRRPTMSKPTCVNFDLSRCIDTRYVAFNRLPCYHSSFSSQGPRSGHLHLFPDNLPTISASPPSSIARSKPVQNSFGPTSTSSRIGRPVSLRNLQNSDIGTTGTQWSRTTGGLVVRKRVAGKWRPRDDGVLPSITHLLNGAQTHSSLD